MNRIHSVALFCAFALLACGADPPANTSTSTDTGIADMSTPDTGDESDAVSDTDVTADVPNLTDLPETLGGVRPAVYHLPASYDGVTPLPALILLHGYTGNGTVTADWWQLIEATNAGDTVLIVPEGLVDPSGSPFWNATDFCCDFWGSGVDDVAYISGLAEEAVNALGVDPQRIHLIGHSNGGFMAHRIACERPELFASVVNFAGATWLNEEECDAPRPVSLLQVHGTWDTTIFYAGLPDTAAPNAEDFDLCMETACSADFGTCQETPACVGMLECFGTCTEGEDRDACTTDCFESAEAAGQIAWMDAFTCGVSAGCFLTAGDEGPGYASASEGAARWAAINGCDASQSDGTPLDLLTEIPGNDTYPRAYDGCPEGLTTELWRIERGSHVPGFNENWATAVVDWLARQTKQ